MMDTLLAHLHALELPTPFPVGPVTVYLADAPGEPLTLLDTGPRTPETQSALEEGLAALGYVPADLERIIISHAHADHFGLAADLVALSGAQVWTHARNAPALADYVADRARRHAFYADILRRAAVPLQVVDALRRATQGVNRFARPVAVDATLADGDTLQLAGRRWQVLHTPGHTGGLICLYEPQSRILLSSDHLLADISSNAVLEPPPPGRKERPRSLALYLASLRRVAALGAARALPGHGPVISDVTALATQRLAFHKGRAEQVLTILRGGAQTVWDVVQALFPDREPLDTFLAVSEVIGHLDLLEMEGRVRRETAGEAIYYRAIPADQTGPTDRR